MNQMRRGKLNLPDEETDFEMYLEIINRLENAGYDHYEISNFSKKGYESAHNLVYWDNAEYYGFGAGASGYVNGIRYKNHGPIHHYLENADKKVSQKKLSIKEKIEEEMFLGLRKKSGVSLKRFKDKFGQDAELIYGSTFHSLIEKKFLKRKADRISLTKQGLMLGNDVFETFLLDDNAPFLL
jgi:oxygen-independent coproporphyrinogen-3 oxidase